ncbi:HD domain-containing protein [Paraburkholderia jirisanensis]
MLTVPQSYNATYTTMADSTLTDVEHIVAGLAKYTDPEYLTELYSKLLVQLKHSKEGFPIDRFEHSLQSASLAFRDGRDTEYVICALLHDVGELFDPYSHDSVIASLLKNYVSPSNYFILKNHTTFQGYYYWEKIGLDKNSREKFSLSPYYAEAIEFVDRYDDKAFDTSYQNMKIDDFKPMMIEFFSNRRKSPAVFE